MVMQLNQRRYLLSIIALCCFAFTLSAQNFIKGTVVDSTNTPIPYCAMAILNAKDSSLVKGNVANESGEFIFENIKVGNYIVKFTNVGFKAGFSAPATVDSLSQLILPPQILKAEGITLKEVSVSAFKPTIEFKNGIVVMNVENNILSGGNTVFELLKRIPGVVVDAQNNISVNGQGGVRFLIDGRLQQIPTAQMINMLMGMPAESVSTLELIKNPPAKYDAAGSGGLINIVLKKAKVKGFSGSLSESNSHGDLWRGGTFLALNFKTNKLTLFTNSNFGWWNFETNNYFQRSISNNGSSFDCVSYGVQYPSRHAFFLSGGLEYEFSKKTIAGINYNGSSNAHFTNTGNSWLDITHGNIYPYNRVNFLTTQTSDVNNPSLNLTLQHKFDTLTKIQLMADYTNYFESSTRNTNNLYYDNAGNEVIPRNLYASFIHSNFNVLTQKLDLTRDFKKSLTLETGFKSSFVDNASNSVFQLTALNGQLSTDTSRSFSYKYTERILAGYFTLSKSFKKLELRGGLRTEHTLINAYNKNSWFSLHRDYINFFPSGGFDYKFNEKHNVQFNYSYRIDRPNYDQMNPAKTFYDQFAGGAGNPYLKPQYSHFGNMDYSFKGMITLSAAYQQINGFIYNYAYGNNNTTVDTTFNYPQRNNYSLSMFMQKGFKWFNFNTYVAGIYRTLRGSVNGYSANTETFQGYANFTAEFVLPKSFKIQLQGFYSSSFTDGVQFYYPIGVANFTILKSFFNKKLDVSFSIFDVFYTDRQPYTNTVGGQHSYYTERNDTRRLRGFIVWKFGKMRINKALNSGPEAEKARLKQVG